MHGAPGLAEVYPPLGCRLLYNLKPKRHAVTFRLYRAPPLYAVPDGNHEFFDEVEHLLWIVRVGVRISVTEQARGCANAHTDNTLPSRKYLGRFLSKGSEIRDEDFFVAATGYLLRGVGKIDLAELERFEYSAHFGNVVQRKHEFGL